MILTFAKIFIDILDLVKFKFSKAAFFFIKSPSFTLTNTYIVTSITDVKAKMGDLIKTFGLLRKHELWRFYDILLSKIIEKKKK